VIRRSAKGRPKEGLSPLDSVLHYIRENQNPNCEDVAWVTKPRLGFCTWESPRNRLNGKDGGGKKLTIQYRGIHAS